MNLAITTSPIYSLIDSGNGKRLEKIGGNTIVRPDSTCIWRPQESADTWRSAHAVFENKADGKGAWVTKQALHEPWLFNIVLPGTGREKGPKITCSLRLSHAKNIGIFPEQLSNWVWMSEILRKRESKQNVLNLFGYTGAASLVAAAQGAQVCHVDASQAAVTWARQNQAHSGLEQAPIRWIVDDCLAFMKREVKRGAQYNGIIMDPPAFGRDPKGKVFTFEGQIHALLSTAKELLSKKDGFLVLNGYAMGYPAEVVGNLLREHFPKDDIECGELQILHEDQQRLLSCSIYARFCR
ncbi:SAM-dependent methyltransferase [bacterium]|nr:SAM-dependent methyltransferase [bacterium]